MSKGPFWAVLLRPLHPDPESPVSPNQACKLSLYLPSLFNTQLFSKAHLHADFSASFI